MMSHLVIKTFVCLMYFFMLRIDFCDFWSYAILVIVFNEFLLVLFCFFVVLLSKIGFGGGFIKLIFGTKQHLFFFFL